MSTSAQKTGFEQLTKSQQGIFNKLFAKNVLSEADLKAVKKALREFKKKGRETCCISNLDTKSAKLEFIRLTLDVWRVESLKQVLRFDFGIETRTKKELAESAARIAFLEQDYTPAWMQRELDKMHADKGFFQLSPDHALD